MRLQINQSVGASLARFRHENSQATQQWIADHLSAAIGRKYQVLTIRRMESGKRGFSAAELFAIADMIGTTPQAVTGRQAQADHRADAKAVSDFLHRQIRLLQGTRMLIQQAGLDGTSVADVPFRSLAEVIDDAEA